MTNPHVPENYVEPKTFTGTICILDRTGDTKIMWSADRTIEVDVARETFRRLRAGGYLIYKAEGKDGGKGEQVNEFNPAHERLIAVPAPVGG